MWQTRGLSLRMICYCWYDAHPKQDINSQQKKREARPSLASDTTRQAYIVGRGSLSSPPRVLVNKNIGQERS